MPIARSGDYTLSIVLVLNFHASKATDVDIGAEVAASGHTLRDGHVHIESFVGLALAVRDASLLLSGLNLAEVSINAVLVALAEKEGGKRGSHQALPLMLGVLCPIRHFSNIYIKSDSFIRS